MAFASKHLISRNNIVGWFAGDESPIYSGATLVGATDLAGVGNLSVAASNPTVETGIEDLNDRSAFVFSGSSDPLSRPGPVVVQQVFALVSADDATSFSATRGFVSGTGAGDQQLLVGQSGTAKFADVASGTQKFYSRGYSYAATNQIAPVGGNWALVEIRLAAPATLSGLQIGKNRTDAASLLDGRVAEVICYSAAISGRERQRLYQYFAVKYHHWEMNTDGNYVFPFYPNWGSGAKAVKSVLVDEAMDGSMVYRTKRSKRKYFDLDFNRRTDDETQAVEKFYDEHFPGVAFQYRDRTVHPGLEYTVVYDRDAECEITSDGVTSHRYRQRFHQASFSVGGGGGLSLAAPIVLDGGYA
ncbi:MAG: hypothetical protein ACK4S4_15855 [Pyrinomonadaceae bacterium]